MQMAVIAIFCDGTWNSLGATRPTHVERLARVAVQSDAQKVLYFAGVGTGVGAMSSTGRVIDRLGGGLFGWGLNRNIKSAYRELCRVHQPGDKIMVFGFSRGAYTARSLVGMIRKCGILEEASTARVNEVFRLYRLRGEENAPDQPHIRAARRRLSPRFATSPTDVVTRNDDSFLVRIAYLGVWDTVGALGIPGSLLGPIARIWNRRYAFHDTSLSGLVEQARHALALDEKRVFYEPALWTNLEASDTGSGLNSWFDAQDLPYRQIWFAGVHGTVGGSTEKQGLAGATLLWIWEGACALGLRLKVGVNLPQEPLDPAQDAEELGAFGPVYRVLPWLLAWRRGPALLRDIHPSVGARLVARSDYRPGSLSYLEQ